MPSKWKTEICRLVYFELNMLRIQPSSKMLFYWRDHWDHFTMQHCICGAITQSDPSFESTGAPSMFSISSSINCKRVNVFVTHVGIILAIEKFWLFCFYPGVLAVIFAALVLMAIILGRYVSRHKGEYLTHEDIGSKDAPDADTAVVHGVRGHDITKKREWFI